MGVVGAHGRSEIDAASVLFPVAVTGRSRAGRRRRVACAGTGWHRCAVPGASRRLGRGGALAYHLRRGIHARHVKSRPHAVQDKSPRGRPCAAVRLLRAGLHGPGCRRFPAGADDERRARAGARPVAMERLAQRQGPRDRAVRAAAHRAGARFPGAAAGFSRRRTAAAAAALRVPQQAALCGVATTGRSRGGTGEAAASRVGARDRRRR